METIPRRNANLRSVCDAFVEFQSDAKPSTRTTYKYAIDNAIRFWGESKPVGGVTEGDADGFRKWLLRRRKLDQNTVALRCSVMRSVFRFAKRRRMIEYNPFADITCRTARRVEKSFFVTRPMVDAIMDACPDDQWRAIFALSRFGGLRNPSETMGLQWQHVDWPAGTMTVNSPKTAHHVNHDRRTVPIFTELRPYLEAIRADAGPVITIGRTRREKHILPPHMRPGAPPVDEHTSIRYGVDRIIRMAGLKPWPKLWNNMRASRETELAESYPIHVVCAWIGNSQRIAAKHYLQVTDEHIQRAQGVQHDTTTAAI